jgi:hypothetical protein
VGSRWGCRCGRGGKLHGTSTVRVCCVCCMDDEDAKSHSPSPARKLAFHNQSHQLKCSSHTRIGTARPTLPSPPNLGKHQEAIKRYLLTRSLYWTYSSAHALALAATQLHASCCHSLSAYPEEPCRACVVRGGGTCIGSRMEPQTVALSGWDGDGEGWTCCVWRGWWMAGCSI